VTPEERVKRDIADIASRPKSVRFNEIENVVAQLSKLGYRVSSRKTREGVMFTVPPAAPFNVCTHHRGSSQLNWAYVRDFLNAMTELQLYEG
jgi:hypothetical protein